jgi:putative membrane protein
MDTVVYAIVAVLASALVIFIVGKMNLGISISGFVSAIIAAVVIAIVGAIVIWLLGSLGISAGTGILGAIVYLIVAAVVIKFSGRFVPGMQVSGFTGAIVAAIAIGIVSWILYWLAGLLNIV